VPLVLMSPLTFVARPERWLQAVGLYRATITAAPNFAYARCSSRIAPDGLRSIDLSSLRLAICGAEPVSARTMRAFAERFARYGFDARALTPVYGLAENTLGLTFSPPGRGMRVDRISRGDLAASRRAVPAAPGDDVLELVSCGQRCLATRCASSTWMATICPNASPDASNSAVHQRPPVTTATTSRPAI
jgi:fatty-acyl-CoA synthase